MENLITLEGYPWYHHPFEYQFEDGGVPLPLQATEAEPLKIEVSLESTVTVEENAKANANGNEARGTQVNVEVKVNESLLDERSLHEVEPMSFSDVNTAELWIYWHETLEAGVVFFGMDNTTWSEPGTGETGTNGLECIWIGMLPINTAEHTASAQEKNASAPEKGAAIGTGNITVVQHQPNALRVVCVLAHTQNECYTLVEEKDGLFEARRDWG
ncbi:hypothetical protein BDR22DRAFT_970301 [Usnea florida]